MIALMRKDSADRIDLSRNRFDFRSTKAAMQKGRDDPGFLASEAEQNKERRIGCLNEKDTVARHSRCDESGADRINRSNAFGPGISSAPIIGNRRRFGARFCIPAPEIHCEIRTPVARLNVIDYHVPGVTANCAHSKFLFGTCKNLRMSIHFLFVVRK